MDVPTTQNPALVTDLEINLGICQHAFKFLPNTVSDKNSWDTFFLVVLPLSLLKLFIAVQSPNLVHQHWGDKETQKCPNNFDWDCRRILREMADCKQSTEDRSTYCTFSTFSRIKNLSKRGDGRLFQARAKKKYYSNFPWFKFIFL